MTLHEYLAIRDLKPSAFAAELGVPASTITRLINGERSPRLELIGRIQTATGGKVTANDFLAIAPTSQDQSKEQERERAAS